LLANGLIWLLMMDISGSLVAVVSLSTGAIMPQANSQIQLNDFLG
jgi:hypothetical protein